jgi:hypothetical protein
MDADYRQHRVRNAAEKLLTLIQEMLEMRPVPEP